MGIPQAQWVNMTYCGDTSGTVGKYDIWWGCLRRSGATIVDIPHVVDIADVEYIEHIID